MTIKTTTKRSLISSLRAGEMPGSVELRKYIDCNFVTDERIVDGFYFASCMRYLHNLLSDPWQLDQPPEEVIRDEM